MKRRGRIYLLEPISLGMATIVLFTWFGGMLISQTKHLRACEEELAKVKTQQSIVIEKDSVAQAEVPR